MTHPTPEAPADGLIEELRQYANGELYPEYPRGLCSEAAEALTQAAARIQVLEGKIAAVRAYAVSQSDGLGLGTPYGNGRHEAFGDIIGEIDHGRSALAGETGT